MKMTKTFCGTPDYIAPEMIKNQYYGKSVDWWAFGVLIYEMLNGQPPFDGVDEDELFQAIMEATPSYPRSMSRESQIICASLLRKDPKKRLACGDASADEIKGHVFYRLINWERLERLDIQPPFKPRMESKYDTANFDKEFVKEVTDLTPVDKAFIKNIDQSDFDGFNFTNFKFKSSC
ncbi:Oidioi.mRNA.OKI2018_I69.XSR.g14037.t1.cds [Oikopleura dioica]|uniref:Oidioi.mRNA.OKI2018_I69.XSR.g14037.t1.cds n=1 Tax=Oikopleura dioica TaxID=34765 RepID=A0ABN7S8N9_OIKDI|nr:Oidioi.mRNA.OKI2018_I69.XSR.g14037.t1.cds [Oikopleura dioica]